MNRYTLISHYLGKYYLNQYEAQTINDAIQLWGQNLDKKIYMKEQRLSILEEIKDPIIDITAVKGLKDVWITCYLDGKYFLILLIIQTAWQEMLLASN